MTGATGGASAAISVRGLVKCYGDRTVVDRIDLEVARGELLALLGPNGAGKTTTVEILEGYRRADAGEVRVLGLDPAADGAALRARVGLMLQGGGGLPPAARPREVVRLFAAFFADPRDPDELLALVGLDGVATAVRRLSGGERQRLALALALVGRPELLLLDEPTAGMDPAAKAATRTTIGALRDAGTTVLLTTHELGDVEFLADRVAILDRGRIVATGTIGDLTRGDEGIRFRPAAPLDPTDAHHLGALPDGRGWYAIDLVAPNPAAIARLAAWAAERGLLLHEIRAGSASLEDRYLELTGDRGGSDR